VRLSPQPALHGFCRGSNRRPDRPPPNGEGWPASPIPAAATPPAHRRRPPTRSTLTLDSAGHHGQLRIARYPPPRPHRLIAGRVVGVGWGVTIRCRIFRHYSVQLSPHSSRTPRNHCRPSPCDRLSRPPWQVVTPATTTAAPPHPWPVGRRCAQPERPRWLRGPGRTRGGSRVHLLIARRRRHPARPLRHRRGYPAARHHGLPISPPTVRGVPRLRDGGDGCASPPAQIRQVRAGASLRGVERRFLAYAFPPRSPHPRRLAVPTRHGFVGAACHRSQHLPGTAAPSFTVPLRRDGGEGLSPPHNQQAPHGAPADRRIFMSAIEVRYEGTWCERIALGGSRST
jgi:hypothetical protein